MSLMIFHVNHDNGHIAVGPLTITWGNAIVDLDLPGFFTFGVGPFFLEMGDIDQGQPGVYITEYVDGHPYPFATIWSVK
ncbi:hypothetical protein SCRES2_gp62 [Synechococcus phage S-CRES2]|nr:hypothetical protein SCRES1_gp57 [Synechococcus phage S-CRES1]WGL30601.1 hypothetical protein SCRES2_gp62 [Synechococcus phage S-CRES2]